jgi:hypothetical protein
MHPTHQKQLEQYKVDALKAVMEGDYSLVKDKMKATIKTEDGRIFTGDIVEQDTLLPIIFKK